MKFLYFLSRRIKGTRPVSGKRDGFESPLPLGEGKRLGLLPTTSSDTCPRLGAPSGFGVCETEAEKRMRCPRCRTKMQVETHRPHKQEKWRCPQCGKVRMKPASYRRNKYKVRDD